MIASKKIKHNPIDDIDAGINNIKKIALGTGMSYMKYTIETNSDGLYERIKNYTIDSKTSVDNVVFAYNDIMLNKPDTIVFSVFAAKIYAATIKTQLIALGQIISDQWTHYDWDAKIVTVDAGRFLMIDLIVSRMKQPQLIFLSYPLMHSYYLFDKNLKTIQKQTNTDIDVRELFNQTYLYHGDKIGEYYMSQIDALDNSLNADKLTQLFNIALNKYRSDYIDKYIDLGKAPANFASGIVLLNINWLALTLAAINEHKKTIESYMANLINSLIDETEIDSSFVKLNNLQKDDVLYKVKSVLKQQINNNFK